MTDPASMVASNLRILLVDDNRAIHEDFRKILGPLHADPVASAAEKIFDTSVHSRRRPSFELDSAFQGPDALALLEKALAAGRPHAVAFVDVRMPPGWDGIETASRMWKVSPDLQVVICTAYSDYSWDEMVGRLEKHSGQFVILKKPFDTIEVLQLASALTEKWRLQQEVKQRIRHLESVVRERTVVLQETNTKLVEEIAERRLANESQARLATAVEQSIDAIVITDPAGEIVYVNPAFEKVTGYSQAEAVGRKPSLLRSGKHDTAFYRRMWDTLLRAEVWSGRITNRKKNGSLYEEEMTISPVLDSAGKVVNYVAVKRDVTREAALEAQLRQSQKLEAIGQLSGGIAHDFNNILTVIHGNASLLLAPGTSLTTENRIDCTQQIVLAANRAAGLTRQLLLFSRKQIMQPADFDLNRVVRGMTRMLKRILGEDIELRAEFAPNLPLVFADAGMIEQVILNLAVNARDAMPEGGQLVIRTSVRTIDAAEAQSNPDAAIGPHVCFAVADTGHGIPPAVLPRIFDPFFTTKPIGKGTGLGLSTVHGIVKQHRGWIEVTSEVGRGATFHIYLPASAAGAVVKDSRAVPANLPCGDETILIAEDESPVRQMVVTLLEGFGYSVLAAESGAAALQLWQSHKHKIHLLLTDLVMPDGLNGRELADKLLAEQPSLKVIYTSGYGADVARGLPLTEGVNFLPKPYAPHELAQTVRENLDRG